MFDKNLHEQVLRYELQSIIEEYDPLSIYYTGSFATDDLWILGVSDIDIKIFADAKANCIKKDITEKCQLFYKKENGDFSFNEKENVIINAQVMNCHDFEDKDSWRKFIANKQYSDATILIEQLFFSGNHELVYGQEIAIPTFEPSTFRQYVIAQTPQFIGTYQQYTLMSEIKIILTAIKYYQYLWTGIYYYHNNELCKSIKLNFEPEICAIFEKVISILDKVRRGAVEYRTMTDTYLLETKLLIGHRKKVLSYLDEKDKEICTNKNHPTIDTIFACHLGLVK